MSGLKPFKNFVLCWDPRSWASTPTTGARPVGSRTALAMMASYGGVLTGRAETVVTLPNASSNDAHEFRGAEIDSEHPNLAANFGDLVLHRFDDRSPNWPPEDRDAETANHILIRWFSGRHFVPIEV